MMEDFWVLNIFELIEEMSDIEFQKDAWLGKSKKVSSFNELINSLYDDNEFENFIESDFWNTSKIENRQFKLMLDEINALINSYNEPKSDLEILKDPEWHKIVAKAKEIVDYWILAIKKL